MNDIPWGPRDALRSGVIMIGTGLMLVAGICAVAAFLLLRILLLLGAVWIVLRFGEWLWELAA